MTRTGTSDSPEELDSLQALALDFLETSGAPGVTVAVARGTDPVHPLAAGVRSREYAGPLRPDDRFMAGSVGKTLVAAAVVSLVLDGVLELDRPIAELLGHPGWLAGLPNGRSVTARTLLSHTSGIPDHLDDPDFAAAAGRLLAAQDGEPPGALEPEQLVDFVAGNPPLFAPGEDYHYADTNYIVLGLVVEALTGRDVFALIDERFLEPLDLGGIVPALGPRIPDLVTGYSPDNALGLPEVVLRDDVLVVNPATEWTGGGFAATAPDLARWLRTLLDGRTLLGDEGVRLMLEGAPAGAEGRYGLGLSLGESRFGPTAGHAGVFPGYRSSVTAYLDHDLVIAVMANRDDIDPGRLVSAIAAALLDDGAPVAAPEGTAGEACDPSRSGAHLAGTWRGHLLTRSGQELPLDLELQRRADALSGTWRREGVVWTLKGSISGSRLELRSVGEASGPAADQVSELAGIELEARWMDGRLTEGRLYPVIGDGDRITPPLEWNVRPPSC